MMSYLLVDFSFFLLFSHIEDHLHKVLLVFLNWSFLERNEIRYSDMYFESGVKNDEEQNFPLFLLFSVARP